MRTQLNEILICPACHGPLNLEAAVQQDDQIESGRFDCPGCQRHFEIRDGVPRFLLTENPSRNKITYDAQWRYRLAGQFEQKNILYFHDLDKLVGWWFSECLANGSEGEWLLDAGCGSGEKAEAMARRQPHLQVVAMDMVDSLELSEEKGRQLPNLHFVQADLLHPPFRPATFNRVLSWGVLHHVEDTKSAFEAVARLLAPGGRILVWVFPHPEEDPLLGDFLQIRAWPFFNAAHLLPPSYLLWLVEGYCYWMSPLLQYQYEQNKPPGFEDRPYYIPPETLSLNQRFKSAVFVIYDLLVAENLFPQRRAAVEEWFEEFGFEDTDTDNLGHYWGRLGQFD